MKNRWLDHHNAIVQLSLRAVLQTAQLKEETIYSKLLSAEKVVVSLSLSLMHSTRRFYFIIYGSAELFVVSAVFFSDAK
jgi:hypothetical protein